MSRSFVIVSFSIMFACANLFAQSPQDLIPPEILKAMDPEILAGKRPKIATITQKDIFSLRETPKRDGDVVVFSFLWSDLSSVQKDIVRNWSCGGHNRIWLRQEAIHAYAELFGAKISRGNWGSEDRIEDHPVNVDCKEIYFSGEDRQDPGGPWRAGDTFCSVDGMPGAVVVAEAKFGSMVCGSFRFGETVVFVSNRATRNDGLRWTLNFAHWMLGLPIPGAADRTIGGVAKPLTLNEATKYDALVMKNGDNLSGTVGNESFTLKTSYASMTLKREDVTKIVLEGAGTNVDIVHLKCGDRISGMIEDKRIRVKPVSADPVELDRDKVREIRFRPPAEPPLKAS